MITFSNANDDYVELPDPELRDTHAKSQNFKVLTARDGSVRTVFQKHGADRNILIVHVSFKNVKPEQAQAFKEFIELNKNTYLTYTDYDSIEWMCLIIDDTLTITNVDRNNRVAIDFNMRMWEV